MPLPTDWTVHGMKSANCQRIS